MKRRLFVLVQGISPSPPVRSPPPVSDWEIVGIFGAPDDCAVALPRNANNLATLLRAGWELVSVTPSPIRHLDAVVGLEK